MSVSLRPATSDDVADCGKICFDAFSATAARHNFHLDFPSAEVGSELIGHLVAHPRFYGVVVESDGRIVGSNFMGERGEVFGLGPITVEPEFQGRSVGRKLMQHMIDRTTDKGAPSLRLLQAAYNNGSLCLYQKLGFDTCEPISNLCGDSLGIEMPGHVVRKADLADVLACNEICRNVHGFDRSGQLEDAIGQGGASVVECDGAVAGSFSSSTASR